jgi:hypothetical protein
MSILTFSSEDFAVQGRKLPNGDYLATVESAQVAAVGNGTSFIRQYGNLRTPEGATEFSQNGSGTFFIGNRKLFARSWVDHSNETAARIGNKEIATEAVSSGLIEKPAEGEKVSVDMDTHPTELVGRDVLVRTKLKPRNKEAKQEYENPSTTPARRAELEAEFEPQIIAWLEQK